MESSKVTDELRSWNDTPTKAAIMDFVAAVTDQTWRPGEVELVE
jgi:hypothetical protein